MRNDHVKHLSTPSEKPLVKMLYIMLFSVPPGKEPHNQSLLEFSSRNKNIC